MYLHVKTDCEHFAPTYPILTHDWDRVSIPEPDCDDFALGYTILEHAWDRVTMLKSWKLCINTTFDSIL